MIQPAKLNELKQRIKRAESVLANIRAEKKLIKKNLSKLNGILKDRLGISSSEELDQVIENLNAVIKKHYDAALSKVEKIEDELRKYS